jgi:hypothetical protein
MKLKTPIFFFLLIIAIQGHAQTISAHYYKNFNQLKNNAFVGLIEIKIKNLLNQKFF